MKRIFLAFPVPAAIVHEIHTFFESVKNTDGVRWTRDANLHVTLFFIGEVEVADIPKVREKIRTVLSAQAPFSLRFDCFTFSGKLPHPSMIWARFLPQYEFSKMSEKVFQAVRPYMTITPQHKDPIPHVTIARIRHGAKVNQLKFPEDHVIELPPVDYAELWQTVHTEEGVVYENLERFSFREKGEEL